MNTHPTELLPAYVLGALDEEDAHHVAIHLRLCPLCRGEADEFRASVGMAEGFPSPEPPPTHIKHRLMSRVGGAHGKVAPARLGVRASDSFPGSGWARALTLLSVTLALCFGVLMTQSRRELADTRASLEALQNEQPGTEVAITSFLSDPATVSQTMSGTQPGSSARMYMQAGHNRAVLLASGLPSPAPGTIYQFWLADGAEPIPGAVFTVDDRGVAQVLFDAPAPVSSYGEAMVTVEPSGGSTTPSSTVVFAAKLAA